MHRGHLKLLVVAFSDRLYRPDVCPDQLRPLVKSGELLESCCGNRCHESSNIPTLKGRQRVTPLAHPHTGTDFIPRPASPPEKWTICFSSTTACGGSLPCSFWLHKLNFTGPLSATIEGYHTLLLLLVPLSTATEGLLLYCSTSRPSGSLNTPNTVLELTIADKSSPSFPTPP